MSELTIHTGAQDSSTIFHVEWFDENGCRLRTELEVRIRPQDKPRTLEIVVNGVCVATVTR